MRNICLNGLNDKQVAPMELLKKYTINATNSKPLRGYYKELIKHN